MSGGAFCFRLKNILKIVAQKLAQLQKTLYLCVIKVTNQSPITPPPTMSLQALSTLLLSDITSLDRDIERGFKFVSQDFEKAFSSGTLEDLRKRQIQRTYLEPLHSWGVYHRSNPNHREDILVWLEKSREEIYRELTQGRLKGRSNCPWHNLNHEYRMEVYAALLPVLSNYIKVYNQ